MIASLPADMVQSVLTFPQEAHVLTARKSLLIAL